MCVCVCCAMTFSIVNNTIKWIYVCHAICIHKILDIPDAIRYESLKLCNVGQELKRKAHTKIHKASETAVGRGKESTEVGRARFAWFAGTLGAPIIQFNHAKCPLRSLPPSPLYALSSSYDEISSYLRDAWRGQMKSFACMTIVIAYFLAHALILKLTKCRRTEHREMPRVFPHPPPGSQIELPFLQVKTCGSKFMRRVGI